MTDCYDPENVHRIMSHILDGSFVKDNVARGVTVSDNYALILAEFIRREQLTDDPDLPKGELVHANRKLLHELIQLRGTSAPETKLLIRRAIRRIEKLENALIEIQDIAEQVE